MTTYQVFLESGWGFPLAIFAFISLVINIIQLIRAHKTKALTVNTNFEPFGKPVKDLLEKSHSTIEIPHLTRFEISMKNSGNVDLTPDQFTAPIELNFGTDVEYLDLRITNQQIIEGSLNQGNDKLMLEPFLLKTDEEIEITGFISSETPIENKDIRIRIQGFKIIPKDQGHSKLSEIWTLGISVIALIVSGLLMIFGDEQISEYATIIGSTLIAVIVMVTMEFVIIGLRKRKN